MMALMVVVNQIMNLGATTFFALSGEASSWQRFILYQIIGGLCGLGINLTYAGMVRYSSAEIAAAIGIGLSFATVQVFSSFLIFRIGFTIWQWFGVCLVLVGIVLIALARPS